MKLRDDAAIARRRGNLIYNAMLALFVASWFIKLPGAVAFILIGIAFFVGLELGRKDK